MKANEIRRRRVLELLNGRFKGNKAAFAGAIGRQPSQVSRWFMKTANARDIGESIARDIEARLGLPRLSLDSETESLTVQQPFALYSVDPEQQATVLQLFDKLTAAQRDDFIKQIAAAVEANEVVVREVGPRLRHPPDEYVGKFLPKVPNKTDIRQQPTGGGK